jgi:hypothetical protein
MATLKESEKKKIEEMSEKYNLTFEEVKDIVYSPIEMMRETISNIDIDQNASEEEFKALKTNFNMPKLFKLHASYYAFKQIIKKKNNKEQNEGK